jgi:prepilin-type processing-associated H-X9-DG protein
VERTREPSLLTVPLRSRAGERNQGRLIEDDSPYLPVDGGWPDGRARRPCRADTELDGGARSLSRRWDESRRAVRLCERIDPSFFFLSPSGNVVFLDGHTE